MTPLRGDRHRHTVNGLASVEDCTDRCSGNSICLTTVLHACGVAESAPLQRRSRAVRRAVVADMGRLEKQG